MFTKQLNSSRDEISHYIFLAFVRVVRKTRVDICTFNSLELQHTQQTTFSGPIGAAQ